jgi:hypothetical protein
MAHLFVIGIHTSSLKYTSNKCHERKYCIISYYLFITRKPSQKQCWRPLIQNLMHLMDTSFLYFLLHVWNHFQTN